MESYTMTNYDAIVYNQDGDVTHLEPSDEWPDGIDHYYLCFRDKTIGYIGLSALYLDPMNSATLEEAEAWANDMNTKQDSLFFWVDKIGDPDSILNRWKQATIMGVINIMGNISG